MARSVAVFIVLLFIALLFLLIRDFMLDSKKQPTAETGVARVTEPENPSGNLQNWREFTSLSKSFKISLPALPQHVADKIPDPLTGEMRKYETYLAAGDRGAAFMINSITLSKKVDLELAEEHLKNVLTEIISRNKENKLKSIIPGKFREYPSLDFMITSENDMIIAGKVFTNGHTIYVLSMVATPSAFKPEELASFVNSFELLEKKR